MIRVSPDFSDIFRIEARRRPIGKVLLPRPRIDFNNQLASGFSVVSVNGTLGSFGFSTESTENSR